MSLCHNARHSSPEERFAFDPQPTESTLVHRPALRDIAFWLRAGSRSQPHANPEKSEPDRQIPRSGKNRGGGQGQVYRVLHPTLQKELALKLGCATRGGRSSQRRPDAPRGQGCSVDCDHPNLVRVVDFDFHEGRPFLAMELVRGRNLAQYAKDRRPSPREAARIVAELSRAVAYIHARGILHQDIKPSNVLIDETDHPRLIDFGLARMRDAWCDETTESIGGTIYVHEPRTGAGQRREGRRRDRRLRLGRSALLPPNRPAGLPEHVAIWCAQASVRR